MGKRRLHAGPATQGKTLCSDALGTPADLPSLIITKGTAWECSDI